MAPAELSRLQSGADKSLARPTSRCILFDGENISFDGENISFDGDLVALILLY
jgi:hypothetical protein